MPKYFDQEQGFTQLGFMVDHLGPSQMAMALITNANQWLRNNFGVSISVFTQENLINPCLPLIFPRYHVRDVMGFKGVLVATSGSTAEALTNAPRARKAFYIYNYADLFNPVMLDDSIIKFSRSVDYTNEVNYGLSMIKHSGIVDDFDIDKILEITCPTN